jgi:hypothetical protein
MELNSLLCCYHPTTIHVVENESVFLKDYFRELKIQRHTLTSVNNNIIKSINRLGGQHYYDRFVLFSKEEEVNGCIKLRIEWNELYKVLDDKRRYEQASIFLVDAGREVVKGIECCRLIKNPMIQKVILCDVIGDSAIIEALNQGVIDCAISKESQNLEEKLKKTIKYLEKKYFSKISEIFIKSLQQDREASPLFCDGEFNQVLDNIKQVYELEEYYLKDSLGDFVGLDKQRRLQLISIRTKKQMIEMNQTLLSLLEESECPEKLTSVMKVVQNKSVMPVFSNEREYNLHPQDWETLLCPYTCYGTEENSYYVGVREISPELLGLGEFGGYALK